MDVYAWFTDDAFTSELKRAQALLTALAKQAAQSGGQLEQSEQFPKLLRKKTARLRRVSL